MTELEKTRRLQATERLRQAVASCLRYAEVDPKGPWSNHAEFYQEALEEFERDVLSSTQNL